MQITLTQNDWALGHQLIGHLIAEREEARRSERTQLRPQWNGLRWLTEPSATSEAFPSAQSIDSYITLLEKLIPLEAPRVLPTGAGGIE